MKHDRIHSCKHLIKKIFATDEPAAVNELVEIGYEIRIEEANGHWYILDDDTFEVIRIKDPENMDVRY